MTHTDILCSIVDTERTAVSGIGNVTGYCCPIQLAKIDGKNSYFNTKTVDAQSCQAECKVDGRCKAWQWYDKWGQSCKLFDEFPGYKSSTVVQSGTCFGPSSNISIQELSENEENLLNQLVEDPSDISA